MGSDDVKQTANGLRGVADLVTCLSKAWNNPHLNADYKQRLTEAVSAADTFIVKFLTLTHSTLPSRQEPL
jgi:hypothetical protein